MNSLHSHRHKSSETLQELYCDACVMEVSMEGVKEGCLDVLLPLELKTTSENGLLGIRIRVRSMREAARDNV